LLARAYLVAHHEALINSALEAYEVLACARELAVVGFVLQKESEVKGVVKGIARRENLNVQRLAPAHSHFGGRTIEIITRVEYVRKECVGAVVERQAYAHLCGEVGT
jgi:hypothetical protein